MDQRRGRQHRKHLMRARPPTRSQPNERHRDAHGANGHTAVALPRRGCGPNGTADAKYTAWRLPEKRVISTMSLGGLSSISAAKAMMPPRVQATGKPVGPVHLGDNLYARQPLREVVRAAGGNPILVCKPSSRRALEEHLRGTVPQGIRRTAGRGSGKCCHRYRRMAGPPRCDGADALRVTRPKVGIAKPGGKVIYRQQHGLRDRKVPRTVPRHRHPPVRTPRPPTALQTSPVRNHRRKHAVETHRRRAVHAYQQEMPVRRKYGHRMKNNEYAARPIPRIM